MPRLVTVVCSSHGGSRWLFRGSMYLRVRLRCWRGLGMGRCGHDAIVPEQNQGEEDACEPPGLSPWDSQRVFLGASG